MCIRDSINAEYGKNRNGNATRSAFPLCPTHTLCRAVPQLTLKSHRSALSTARTIDSQDSERLDELAAVKNELEEALRQVKAEMKAGGATRSQIGSSVCSSRSRCSSVSGFSSMPPTERSMSSRGSSRASSRPSTSRSVLNNKNRKPLVSRPAVSKSKAVEPCPTPSAFRKDQFVTQNRADFVVHDVQPKSRNQGPHRTKKKGKEMSFSKFAENQVNASSLLSSKVFAPRVAAR
eukprot:TRINITY_DN4518_c0_g1_i3.p1 TRINITY_DN4518_c0_g1~~TRINITY_DN4518_c0_g1_i3.p1  ORF type:complete len:234 (-),score=48.87 TRINITY_DN4518_c0_g1_i3:218-919(-)